MEMCNSNPGIQESEVGGLSLVQVHWDAKQDLPQPKTKKKVNTGMPELS